MLGVNVCYRLLVECVRGMCVLFFCIVVIVLVSGCIVWIIKLLTFLIVVGCCFSVLCGWGWWFLISVWM